MRRRALLASLPLLYAAPALAQQSEAALLRTALNFAGGGRWAEAENAVAPFPLASKIIRWVRLTAGPADPDAAARFLADNPDWPSPDLIRRRAEAQVALWPDDAYARQWFTRHPALTPQGRLRQAELLRAAGRANDAAIAARQAWIDAPSDEVFERAVLEKLGPLLKPADHLARFDRLAFRGESQAAARLLPLLPPAQLPQAQAVLALLAGTDTTVDPRDATGFLLRARLLRRQDADGELTAWWRKAPTPTEPERATALWAERQVFARRTLRLGDPATAYAVAAAHGLSGSTEAALEAHFLAGWLALRFLNDAAAADRHFAQLEAVAVSPISVARGKYWRGRAAQGDAASGFFIQAAQHPATYYGQLAILALGEGSAGIATRIAALPQPMLEAEQISHFSGRELARAAALLAEAGERGRTRFFLLRIEQLAPTAADRRLAAALAVALGRDDVGVEIARRTGPKDGTTLLAAGWPEPYEPPGPHRALALALMRQESNFDTGAVSPVGARGLMQLMPATARATARKLGLTHTDAKLTAEPAYNMALGTAYLADQIETFDGAVPLALAAYNAGPHRVRQWLSEAGDPRIPLSQGGADPIDWIERIPFSETRNYVQRVTESIAIYRARANDAAQHPVTAMAER
jgi:soluble lytic murein transglycosylase